MSHDGGTRVRSEQVEHAQNDTPKTRGSRTRSTSSKPQAALDGAELRDLGTGGCSLRANRNVLI
eukprot:2388761-Prymnesium_polylepis.1